MQSHQHATVGAKFGAVGRQARGEQFVFDLIDTQAGLAHDLRQHFALIAQQMHEQFRGRAKAFAGLHRRAQLVHRMQRLQARADDQFAAHADPQRRHVGGDHAAEVEHHIVDHRQQRRIDMLDARRTRTFVQRFEKLLGQLQMTFHPALARGVGQVQVQPEKLFAVAVVLQTAQSRRRIDLAPALTGQEAKAVEQAKQVRGAMADIEAVVHGGSLRGGCLVGDFQVHLCGIIASQHDRFVTVK